LRFKITIVALFLEQLVGVFPGVDDGVHGEKSPRRQHGGHTETHVIGQFDQVLEVLDYYVLSIPESTDCILFNLLWKCFFLVLARFFS